jgi:hypothetical protein
LQQSFSHFPPQQADAVLSLPQSLQHAAFLSAALMQDFASFPPQQDFPSFPAQQEAPSLASAEWSWRAQQECSPFASADAILSQHAHFDFSIAVLFTGAAGAVWVASCAQETAVNAIISANILCFIKSPCV